MNTQMTKVVEITNYESYDLYKMGEFDKAGRWYPNEDIAEYFTHIRSPSRARPLSYWKAAKTKKFFKWHQAKLAAK